MTKSVSIISSAAVIVALVASCTGAEVYKDPSAPVGKRVEDLLSRMTREEKIWQVTQWTYGKNMNENNVEKETKASVTMAASAAHVASATTTSATQPSAIDADTASPEPAVSEPAMSS